MIIIQKAQTNRLSFTLFEKTTIAPAYYYLELFSNQNHDKKAVYLGADSSMNLERYNQFDIEENDVENLDNGIISLEPTTYDYFVWQCSEVDFNTKVSIVESGKAKVNGVASESNDITSKPKEYTFKN